MKSSVITLHSPVQIESVSNTYKSAFTDITSLGLKMKF